MTTWLVAILLTAAATATASGGSAGGRASYLGGTHPSVPSGARGFVEAVDERYFVFYARKESVRIPYERINLLEYGQRVSRRYALAVLISPVFVLAKKRHHYLTLGYQDDNGRQQALVFQVDKSHIRMVLVTLEARTGLKIEYQDEEARKAGKG